MKVNFEDYDCIADYDILSLNEKGICLKNDVFIDFKQCAENYRDTFGGSGKCIGERDMTALSFDFYSSPKPVSIVFIPKNGWQALFCQNAPTRRFMKFKKQLLAFGFTTKEWKEK